MKNRLNLDFHLRTSDERKQYVDAYLSESNEEYTKKYNDKNKPFPFPYHPTNAELETIANYILYGKDTSSPEWNLKDKKGVDGNKSVVDAGYVEIKSRNSAWNRKKEESLDGMMTDASETGVPVESQFGLIGNSNGKRPPKVQYRTPKPSFSRALCRESLNTDCPQDQFLLKSYEDLWNQIDIAEYMITSFELKTGRRIKPIRLELEERLSEEEKVKSKRYVMSMNIYGWSKMRKMLVELRRDQYILRDSYAPALGRSLSIGYSHSDEQPESEFLRVLPCGTVDDSPVAALVFMEDITNEHFRKDNKETIAKWHNDYCKQPPGDLKGHFDFRNLDHVTLLVYAKKDLIGSIEDEYRLEYVRNILGTLDYYIRRSHLDEMHKKVIEMKSDGHTNQEIRTYINGKYDKTYSENYISTIFRSKCCKEINDTAEEHLMILEKVNEGKNEFKECNTCNRILLRDANNFVRKARAKDGLSGRCKDCDKNIRNS